jgi:flagellar hook-associated protein 1
LQQVESIFSLSATANSATSTALGTATNSFFSALSSLASNPSDTATRQNVLTAASSLASAFNSAASQLTQVASSLDQNTVSDASQVNTLTSTIASLNSQITSHSPNADAGALEDQRQQAIAQLSQLVGLDQISNQGNGITLTTSGGAVLVSGSQSFALSTSNVAGSEHVFAGGQDITSNISGGDLGGVLQARNQQLPSYQKALDSLAFSVGTQVNTVNAAGIDANGNAGGNIFLLPTTQSGAAAQIQVATTNPALIAAAGPGEGSAGNANASALAALSTANIANGGTQTASGFLASFLGQIGSDASAATSDNSVQQASLTQLTAQRDSFSAVSLDEEAANLTQFQRAYQAASQVFNTADTVYSSAINLGVETAVN